MNQGRWLTGLAVPAAIGGLLLVWLLAQNGVSYRTYGEALLHQADGSYRRAPLDGRTLQREDVAHYLIVATNRAPVALEAGTSVGLPKGAALINGSTRGEGVTWTASGAALQWNGERTLAPGRSLAAEYMLRATQPFADRADRLTLPASFSTRVAQLAGAGAIGALVQGASMQSRPVERAPSGLSYNAFASEMLGDRTLKAGDLIHYVVIASNRTPVALPLTGVIRTPPFTELVDDNSNGAETRLDVSSNAFRWSGGSVAPYSSAALEFTLRVTGPNANGDDTQTRDPIVPAITSGWSRLRSSAGVVAFAAAVFFAVLMLGLRSNRGVRRRELVSPRY